MSPRNAMSLFGALILGTASVQAGNQQMLQDMSQELIQINENLLKDLGADTSDGRYDVSIRLVERDGKKVVKIDRYSVEPPTEEEASNVYVNYGDYSTFIRYGPIPQAETFGANPASGETPRQSNTTGFHQRVDELAKDYRGVKVLPLDAASLQRLVREKGIQPGGGAVLLYW